MARAGGLLSPGARHFENVLRARRTRHRGLKVCGRGFLSRLMGCTPRQVSRYTAELKAAGRLQVIPPQKVRTARGWRSIGVNSYRLTQPHSLAPHYCRSVRGDRYVTPPLRGQGMDPHRGGSSPPNQAELDYQATLRAAAVPMPADFRARVLG